MPLGSFSPHSPQTQAIAVLFGGILIVCGTIFLVVAGLVGYGLLGKTRSSWAQSLRPGRIETVWTATALAIVTAIFIASVRAMALIDAPKEDASGRTPDLAITGHQWWWDARYPNGAVAVSEIHIPAGRRLLARIGSADVIHDFWVPQLARKMDAVPGRSGYIWLEADAPGTYQGVCSEFCGAQHARMHLLVIAESEAEYAAWLRRQAEPARTPPPALYERRCAGCHTDPAKGPDLTHVAGRRTLGAALSENTPANLALWIAKPQSVKPGNRMPDQRLSNDEVGALAGYLGSLQ